MTDSFILKQNNENKNESDKDNQSHFTSEQVVELENRAEQRDLRRPRKSLFSLTEQAELDETAKNLQFNDIQRAELAYRFRKRLLPFVAYILLIIILIIAFASVNAKENNNHKAIERLCKEYNTPIVCTTLYK